MNTVLDGLASNPALPAPLVSRLVAAADGVLALSLARRSDLSAADVQALMAREDPDVVAALLESGWVQPSSVPVTDVWMALVVAEHPDAPAELVSWLAAHPDPVVRHRLERSARFGKPSPQVEPDPGLTAAEVRVLVSEQGPSLSAARSPQCPPDLLHLMAENAEEPEVLRAIARHPRASGETLLLCLGDAQARHLAAAHPHLPVPMILKLLGSEFTAGPAASNPSLPVAVMEELLDRSGE